MYSDAGNASVSEGGLIAEVCSGHEAAFSLSVLEQSESYLHRLTESSDATDDCR